MKNKTTVTKTLRSTLGDLEKGTLFYFADSPDSLHIKLKPGLYDGSTSHDHKTVYACLNTGYFWITDYNLRAEVVVVESANISKENL